MTERNSPDREAKRRTILEAAIREFAEHGFFSSRIRNIAARAGVAEGTIYLYYGGKDDLLLTAFRDRVDRFCQAGAEILASETSFPERLAGFIRLQFQQIAENPALATVLLLESRQTSKFYAGAVRDVLRTYAGAIDDLLASGVSEGAIRPDVDVPLARRMLIGALEEVELEWLLGDQSRPLESFAVPVAQTFYRGLS